MWLLSTDRAELHHFPSPESVPGGYAILSHTWGNEKNGDEPEQTFQETQDFAAQCKGTCRNPRDLARSKVQASCTFAESWGYRWIWIDTCCINKKSSAEDSEAINSMFRWYSLAEVCFVYMHDVPISKPYNRHDLGKKGSLFRAAKWHSRGWTLQELIAPSFVLFLSQDWKIIGTKLELAFVLQGITGVPSQVLTGEEHYSLFSIAERMSWTSKRNTTRVEDEAYCLMGLFNVNMPTIYGEGRQAFQRLQYEIMKQSFDTSLFAWGRVIRLPTGKMAEEPPEMSEIYKPLNTSSLGSTYILADSPKRFSKDAMLRRTRVNYTPSTRNSLQPYSDDWRKIKHNDAPTPNPSAVNDDKKQSVLGQFDGIMELPTFSVTSYGLKCRFPIIESGGFIIAVLLCDNGHENIGLLLHPSKGNLQDPSRLKYNTGYVYQQVGYENGFARLVLLGERISDLKIYKKAVRVEWREVFISHTPPPIAKDIALSICSQLHSIAPAPPFRLPLWLVNRLARAGMELQRLDKRQSTSTETRRESLCMSLVFEDIDAKERIRLLLGTCTPTSDSRIPASWAKAITQSAGDWHEETDNLHKCPEDHIDSWSSHPKNFGDERRTVQLSVLPCNLAPERTLVVHVELEGTYYQTRRKAMEDLENTDKPGEDPETTRTITVTAVLTVLAVVLVAVAVLITGVGGARH